MARRKPIVTVESTPVLDPTPVKPSRVRIPTPTPPPPSTPTLVCTKCSNSIPTGMKFCPECGTAVPVPTPVPDPTPPPSTTTPKSPVVDLEQKFAALTSEFATVKTELLKLANENIELKNEMRRTKTMLAAYIEKTPDVLDRFLSWLNGKVI